MKKTKLLLALLSIAGVAACGAAFAACDSGHEHSYTESTVEATCTEKGYTLHTCECGDEYKDNYVDELEHDLDTGAAQTKTCTQDGWAEYEFCLREGCGYTTKVVIPMGHVVVEDPAVPYDCTHDGKTAGSHCSECNEVFVEQEVLPAAHQVINDPAVPATCTQEGKTAGSHCGQCNKVLVKQETVISPMHDVDEDNICQTCHQDVTTQGLTFTDIDATTCKLTGLGTASTATAIYIPKEYNGKTVTTIGNKAFNKPANLTGLALPDTVTTLESYALYNCTKLTDLVMSDNLTTIGELGFMYNCSYINYNIYDGVKYIGSRNSQYCLLYKTTSYELTAVTIPEGCKIINYDAFFNGVSAYSTVLETVVFPESLEVILDGAFVGSRSITALNFGNNLKYIGASAFDGCTTLTEVVIPNSVEYIGSGTFYGCRGIKTLSVPFIGESKDSTNTHIGFIYGAKTWNENNQYCELYLRTLKVTGTTTIGQNALRKLSNIENVILSDNVTTIASNAFTSCAKVTVYYEGTAEQWADVQVDATNTALNGKVLYLSADAPVENGWHYVGTVPTKWETE